jgi:L-aspartate oxidase
LQRAQKRIANLQEEIQEYYWDFKVTSDLLELRNIATVAGVDHPQRGVRGRRAGAAGEPGLHYNLDHPAIGGSCLGAGARHGAAPMQMWPSPIWEV